MSFSKDIVTDYSAVADGLYAVTDVTISGTTLTAGSAIFSAPDVGKSISIPQNDNPTFNLPATRTIVSVGGGGTSIVYSGAAVPVTYSTRNLVLAWGTDNATVFNNFRTDTGIQGGTGTLTIPAGIYYISYANTPNLFDGIADLTVNGASATICGGVLQFGGQAEYPDNVHNAFTQSAAAGSLFVDLITSSEASRFTINGWVKMSGYDLQFGGYPSNHQYFEYLQVAGISGGRITFTSALQYSYSSTWPVYNTSEYGGPANLSALPTEWSMVAVYNIATIAQDGEMAANGRDITFNNTSFPQGSYLGTWTGSGPFITQNKSITFNNCNMHNAASNTTMEADKETSLCTFNGCTIDVLNFQSASCDRVVINNCTVLSNVGGPKNLVISGGSVCNSLMVGPTFYGPADTLNVTNSTINWATGSLGVLTLVDGTWSMSGGVITIPNSALAPLTAAAWCQPGGAVCWEDRNLNFVNKRFRITTVTQSGGNTLVGTTWPGGFPTVSGGSLYIRTHPTPIVTGSGNSGNVYSISLNSMSNVPVFSRLVQAGITETDYAVQTGLILWGLITRLSINVRTASTRTGSVSFNFISQCKKNNVYTNYDASVNLKVLGERVITQTGVTGTQAGDSGLTYFNTAVDDIWGPQYCLLQVLPGTGGGTMAVFDIDIMTDGSVEPVTVTISAPPPVIPPRKQKNPRGQVHHAAGWHFVR